MNYIIARLKNEKDADFIVKSVRKFKGKVRVFSDDVNENQWMLKMINEAESEGGEVSEQEIEQILRENGAKI